MVKPKADERDRRIGRRIRVRRNELGLSLASVGSAMGISYQAVQKIEKGEYRISAPNLEALASALGVKANYFLDDKYGVESDDLMAYAVTSEGYAFYRAISKIKSKQVRRQILRTILAISDEYETPKEASLSTDDILAELDPPYSLEPLRRRPDGS